MESFIFCAAKCNLRYNMSKEITIIFYNGSNYDNRFIINKPAERFDWQFTCLGKNTQKYIVFSVAITNEVKRIGKNGEKITKTLSYKLNVIDSVRFITSSLLNLANNLAEGIHKIACKSGHDNKKYEMCGIKYKDC